MHPFLQAQLAALHETDLRVDAARGRGRSRKARGAPRGAPRGSTS